MDTVGWVLLGVALLGMLLAALATSRTRTLTGRVGSFDCAVRHPGRTSGALTPGVAHYGVGRLDWWRARSLSPRPASTWQRSELRVVDREPVGPHSEHLLVHCWYSGEPLELEMSSAAYAGLTSWLEAAPPREHGIVA